LNCPADTTAAGHAETEMTRERCPWCGTDPLYQAYHDEEWGVPLHDEHRLFEFLILEGAQAGLSWLTVLKKRAHYRRVFDGFDPQKVARYSPKKVEALLADPGIVRNRLKVEATVTNARAFLDLAAREPSFDHWLWGFVDGRPVINHYRRLGDVPAETDRSRQLSKALKQRGFRFVGPTIVYAFMQATGMVNDHLTGCFRHHECRELAGL
jgi:DNA-3-methyladenine glycosylase I